MASQAKIKYLEGKNNPLKSEQVKSEPVKPEPIKLSQLTTIQTKTNHMLVSDPGK